MNSSLEASGRRLPLAHFNILRSNRATEVMQRMGSCLSPHHLTVHGDAHRLDVQLNRVPMGEVSIHALHYGAEVTIDPGTRGDFYLLQFPLRGVAQVRSAGHQAQISAGVLGVLHPKAPTLMHWSADCAMILLSLARDVLERRLGCGVPHSPQALQLTAARNDVHVAAWWRAVEDLVFNLDAHDQVWLHYPAATTAMHEFLCSAVVELLKPLLSTHTMATVQGHDGRAMRRAKEFIHAHLSQAMRIHDIASHANVSMRTLELLFKRHEDLTPSDYVRRHRLHAAHEALAKGQGESVTDIAMAHGFVHLGRFASLYRQTYGQSPSETLRKTDKRVAAFARNG